MNKESEFDGLLEKYEPLIKSTLRRLGLQKEYDEAHQIGWIALWEAWMTFDPEKGVFPAYAKAHVQGRLKDFARKIYKHQERFLICSELPEEPAQIFDFDESELDLDGFPLSEREKLWIRETIQNSRTTKELANQFKVSEHTVRSWKKSAMNKLKTNREKEVFLIKK